MAINPLGSQGPSSAGANRAGDGARRVDGTAAATGSGNSAEAVTGDQLELSDMAASLGLSGSVPTGELSAEALQVIAQKLASGAYDGPAAADRLAGKLLDSGDLAPPA